MAIDIISTPPPTDWPRRIAAATFVLLFVFGLSLLVWPDFANEMNERTAGGRVLPLEAVTITESKRTSEEQTDTTGNSSTRATNRRIPTNVSSNNGSGQSGPSRVEKNSDSS
ncbi:MAG TPA: hypothetical protein VEV82_04620, partial [Actinomycetota bacterium]|nr:hypothetical protein [Actinomycetota bacterium]